MKHFTYSYTDKYCSGIQNISRIRQTNKEMPDKAKYTLSGNEACKILLHLRCLWKEDVSVIEGYSFLQCDFGNKETFRMYRLPLSSK